MRALGCSGRQRQGRRRSEWMMMVDERDGSAAQHHVDEATAGTVRAWISFLCEMPGTRNSSSCH